MFALQSGDFLCAGEGPFLEQEETGSRCWAGDLPNLHFLPKCRLEGPPSSLPQERKKLQLQFVSSPPGPAQKDLWCRKDSNPPSTGRLFSAVRGSSWGPVWFSLYTQFFPNSNTRLFFWLEAGHFDRDGGTIILSHLTTLVNGRHLANYSHQEQELLLLAKQNQRHNILPISASFLTSARKKKRTIYYRMLSKAVFCISAWNRLVWGTKCVPRVDGRANTPL